MMTSFDNNENKICLLLKDDVGGSYVRSYARSRVGSYDHRSYNHGVTIAFLFGMSFDKQFHCLKSYLIIR